jgi:hypothetical protein
LLLNINYTNENIKFIYSYLASTIKNLNPNYRTANIANFRVYLYLNVTTVPDSTWTNQGAVLSTIFNEPINCYEFMKQFNFNEKFETVENPVVSCNPIQTYPVNQQIQSTHGFQTQTQTQPQTMFQLQPQQQPQPQTQQQTQQPQALFQPQPQPQTFGFHSQNFTFNPLALTNTNTNTTPNQNYNFNSNNLTNVNNPFNKK